MSGLTKVSETYGTNNYVAFEDASQQRYLAERVESYGLLQFGAMKNGTIKSIDLESLTCPISIKSVYVFSGSTINDEIRFRIYEKQTGGTSNLIATQRFTNNEMPFSFPDGAILFPNQVIEVEPRYDVDNIIIYAKPVDIIFILNPAIER